MMFWFLIGIGIVLRSTQYLFNRSLWLDEAALALNIINRQFSDLTKPLTGAQNAPVGFLFLVKSATILFGNSEYALRMIPFIAGVVSIFLFFYFLKQVVVEGKGRYISLAIFIFSTDLIYYSSELKQYSFGLMMSLILYIVFLHFYKKTNYSLLALIGIFVIWFSQPTVFILASFGMLLFVRSIKNKDAKNLTFTSIMVGLWIASFLLKYKFHLAASLADEGLKDYWQNAFAPGLSLSAFAWYVQSILSVFNTPLGLHFSLLWLIFFIVGCYSLFIRDKEKAIFLLLPIGVTLFASNFRVYPFVGRFLLFLAPIFIVFIGEGVNFTLRMKRRNIAKLSLFLVLIFFLPTLWEGTKILFYRTRVEEMRPVVNYFNLHRTKNDTLYVYYASNAAYQYYAMRNNLTDVKYIVGIDRTPDISKYISDLNQLKNKKRVWILFSHVAVQGELNEEELFLRHLDSIGRRKTYFRVPGASIYLYDLTGT